MKPRHPLLAALAASAGLALRAGAQVPVTPTPLPPPGEPVGIAPHPAVPAGPTIWSKLGISQDQREYCKRKICRTPLGQLLNNSTLPLQGLSGGLIPPFCPVGPSVAELADPGAVGAAAKIKADEAGAKERRAAVRYLGTVDCHYWPEAEEALIGALRGDRNECVRFEAALALGNGCCCTKKTMEALTIVVSCSNRDGAPKENSNRVVAAAQAALNHCIACYGPIAVAAPPPPPPEGRPVAPPESPPEALPAPTPPAGAAVKAPAMPRPTGFQYYARIAQMPLEPILAEARRVAALHPPAAKAEAEALPPGERSVIGLVNYVVGRDAPAPKLAAPPAAAAARTNTPARADGAARPAAGPSRPTNLMAMLAKPTPVGPAIPAPVAPAPTTQASAKTPPAKVPAVTSTHAESPPKLLPMDTELQPRPIAADVAAPSQAPTATATNQAPPATARAPMPSAPVVWSSEPPIIKPSAPAAPTPAATKQAPSATRAPEPKTPPVVWSAEPPLIKQTAPVAPAPAATKQTPAAPAPEPSARPVVRSADEPPAVVMPTVPVAAAHGPAPAASHQTSAPEHPAPPVVWSSEQPPVSKQPMPAAPAATDRAAAARAPEPTAAPTLWSAEPPHTKQPAPAAPAPVVKTVESPPVAEQPAPSPAPAAPPQAPAAAARTPEPAAAPPAVGPALPPVIIQTALATPPQAPPATPLAAAAQVPVTTATAPPAEKPLPIARPQAPRVNKPSAGIATATASAAPAPTVPSPAKSAPHGQSPDRLQPADLQAAPALVDDLIRGATSGTNLAERRACIRALVRCRVKTPAALRALEELQNDQTPQVRVDAIIGLARLQTNQ